MVASTLTSAFTESVDSQSHLLGSYSFLASQGIPKIGADLFSAGFWNYLQEDITVALMQKRRLKIDLSSVQMPTQMEEDDDWANQISFLLGKVINQCLGKEAVALGLSDWTMLLDEVESWKSSLPSSFTAFTPRGPTKSEFPSLWLLHGWHIAALQYYHVTMSILLLAEPVPKDANTWQRIEAANALHRDLEYHAMQLCGMAIANENTSARINAFGPISFCGVWIRDQAQRVEILSELRRWVETTAWPVEDTVHSLSAAWGSETYERTATSGRFPFTS